MITPTLQEIDNIRKKGFRPVVVGCIINADKKLLLLFREEHKLWQLPQGGIDNRESVSQALLREIKEELDEDFVNKCSIPKEPVIYSDQVEFPPRTAGSRELMTNSGEEVFMKGKTYFFCLMHHKGDAYPDLKKSEFDECFWVSYKQAKFLAERLYQKGKKRITLGVLEVLKEKGFID